MNESTKRILKLMNEVVWLAKKECFGAAQPAGNE